MKFIYALAYKCYPDIYKEMYAFYKFNIIPEERFKTTSQPPQYQFALKNCPKNLFMLKIIGFIL